MDAPIITSCMPCWPRHAPQLFQVNLGPADHFAAAWNLYLGVGPSRIEVSPIDHSMPQDADVTYAATFSATQRDSLAQRRSDSTHRVHALSAGLWPATLHLQKALHPQVCSVSSDFHVTFLAVSILLIPGAPSCRILQLRPLGTDPSATSVAESFLLTRKPPERRCQSDGVVGVEGDDKIDAVLGRILGERHQERRRKQPL